MKTMRRSPHDPKLLAVGAGGALLLAIGLVGSGSAAREVLSDMDCTVEPSLVLDLGAAVPGRLAHAHYDRADYVQKGTLLGRLESDVEWVTLALAEALAADGSAVDVSAVTAAFGARTEARNRQLSVDDSIAEQALDQLHTEAAIARLQHVREQHTQARAVLDIERARALLAQREIRSPIEGTVIQRFADAGEYVDGDPVFQVAQLDPLHVEVIVPIDYLDTLRAGASAAVTIDAPGFESRPLPATLRRIDAVADAASATYGVRLELDNADLEIPSGVRCQVDFYAS